MEKYFTMEAYNEAVSAIREYTDMQPNVGLVLGSGLNQLAESIEDAVFVPFGHIPHFPVSTVMGHQGRLVFGQLEGQSVVVMQGRVHYYEGYSMAEVTLPIRVMRLLGISTLIVTNAAGGLNMTYRVGDVMLLRDHINLLGMAGQSPLRGPNIDEFGPRFPNMSQAYDPELRNLAREIALEKGIPHHAGVYVALAGPNYETPADIRFLRLAGADAVGMSTVPEVIVARHSGIRVLGMSGITNTLVGEDNAPPTDHEEVLEAGKVLVPRLETLVRGILRRL